MSSHPEDLESEPTGPTEETTDAGPDGQSKISRRRLEANRANAQKSTGPRTREGKARSSKNPITHGIFVADVEPISSGPFAEDPAQLVSKLDALIASLAPRDAYEYAMATRIASLMNAFDRLERWSAALIDGASRMSKLDYDAGVGSEYLREEKEKDGRQLLGYLRGVVSDEEADFAVLATLVRFYGPDPEVGVRGLWDADNEPQNRDEWEKAFHSLMAYHWPDSLRAEVWASQLSIRFLRELKDVEGLEQQVAARRIMNGPVDLQFKYYARIRRELIEMRKEYQGLQQREIPAPEKTNPTDLEASY